jgi:DNA primase
MISESTIDRILHESDIVDIIGASVTLKKKGQNYTGCCPFHSESTPSFTVSPGKQIYKCFGCGKGGNVVSFVMEHNNKTYPEALRILASKCNIHIEEKESTPEERAIEITREGLKIVNQDTCDYYTKCLTENKQAMQYASGRFKDETLKLFNIGYAPDGWEKLKDWARHKGFREEILLKANLLREKDNRTFDAFVDRLIFPIHNAYGDIIGFAGRYMGADKDQAKYINPAETDLYKKDVVLYGIHMAWRAMKTKKESYLVEGYADCMRMHDIGIDNTVAECGTALTSGQIQQLKKYVPTITLVYDNDAAGDKARAKNGKLIIEAGMQCNIIELPKEYEKDDKGELIFDDNKKPILIKQDPDSFFTTQEQFREYEKKHKVDFITWFADQQHKDVGSNPEYKSQFVANISMLMAKMQDRTQHFYVDLFAKRYKIAKKLWEQELKKSMEFNTHVDCDEDKLPEGINKDDYERYGFFEENNCYYFFGKSKVKASNFTIKPLFHLYSKSDNKRLIEVVNEFGYKKTVDIPSKSFISLDQFQQLVYQEGNYIFFESKAHFFKVLNKLSNEFPIANELKTLGWQREGFFAFSNGIYNGQWQPVDEFGITNHEDDKFFSPAFSLVYKDVREDDDEYENDRFFVYKRSDVSFNHWADLMMEVYGRTNGMFAVIFLIGSLFRDIIYERYKIFPHLFLFGEKQSGKSQLAWSLSNVFLNGQPAFNLNSGTNVGFFRRLARFRNSVVWYDEYTNDVDEKRFQALKAAYDGVGHEKGKMTKDARTEITKVNAACVVSGQYLPTRDDNALFTRSILLSFNKQKFTDEAMANYNMLKAIEEKGLSSIITEILPFREMVDKKFGREFQEIFDKIKGELIAEGAQFEERLVRNFVTIMAPAKIIIDSASEINPGFEFKELYARAKEMIVDLSTKISNSEALSLFWITIEYMLDSGQIKENSDFKIERHPKYMRTPILKNGKKESIYFEEDRELLFIRLTKIHPLYMELHRKQYGTNGVDMTSLSHYMNTSDSFAGLINSTRFGEFINTSAYVFDYEKLGVNLKRNGGIVPEMQTSNETNGIDPF